ncbi:MAG: arsenate reductase (glutaredoxin) [Bacteroidales bacterium]|nr:arsenate reductase (glutaredoxin) [Bacteroidales bacterium]
MLKIYHNTRCKKSRAGLKYLKNKNIDFEIIQYLKTQLTLKDLSEILMKLNKNPQEIIRTQETYYKINLKNKNFTDYEWKRIIIENPKLLQRPIIVAKYKAVIAQPPEKIDELLIKT